MQCSETRSILMRIGPALRCRIKDCVYLGSRLSSPVRLLKSAMYSIGLYEKYGKTINRLNLGGGDTRIDGFCNIDANLYSGSDLIGGIDRLRLRSDSVEVIYCSHVFEHVPRAKCAGVLTEWFRVLRPGGNLYLGVPDLEALFKIYSEKLPAYENDGRAKELVDLVTGIVYGGQTDSYNYHCNGHAFPTMKALLDSVGFVDVRRFEVGSLNFITPPGDGMTSSIDGRPTSLNVSARKPEGANADGDGLV